MTLRRPSSRREKTSTLSRELESLLREEKSGLAVDRVCRVLLRARRIPEGLAARIVRGIAADDARFRLSREGSVRLAASRSVPSVPLSDLRFTVIDLETTGGSKCVDRILEIGAVRVEGGGIVGRFETLVNPGMPIPTFISAMTGIRTDMVEGAPFFHGVADALTDFMGDSVLVAHNLPFDLGFLNRELSRACGFILRNRSLCTVKLGRRLLPHLSDRRLETLADHYGLVFARRHRAAADAEVTAGLLLRFLLRLDEMGLRDWEALQGFLRSGEEATEPCRKVSDRPRTRHRSRLRPSSA